jgi:hypothetical protein
MLNLVVREVSGRLWKLIQSLVRGVVLKYKPQTTNHTPHQSYSNVLLLGPAFACEPNITRVQTTGHFCTPIIR